MANQIPLIVNAGAGQIQQLATGDNLSVAGNVITNGILTDGYYYANGTPVSFGSNYGNANVAEYLPTFTGNLAGNNISVTGNVYTDGKILHLGEITGNGITANGAGIVVGANVATILYDNSVFGWTVNEGWHPAANVTYNLGRTTRYWNNFYAVNVNAVDIAVANSINASNFIGNLSNGTSKISIASSGNVSVGVGPFSTTVLNVNTSTGISVLGNVVASEYISATGNITGNYIFGNGSQLTGLPSAYGNTEVAAYLAGSAGNIIPGANLTYSLGNSTNWWSNVWVAGNTIYIGGVPLGMGAGNVLTVGGNAVLSNDSNTSISTTGNVAANYFIGDGSQLTNLPSGGGLPIANGTSNFDIATVNGNPTVTSNGNTWTFNTDGNLTLPKDSLITETSNVLAITPPPAVTVNGIVAQGTGYIDATYFNQATTGGAGTGLTVDYTVVANQVVTVIVEQPGSGYVNGDLITIPGGSSSATFLLSVTAKSWTFGADGNLTLPGNTFAVNYANGTQVSIGGGGNASTGNVTFDNQIVIGTGSNDGGGGLYLAPGNASIANSEVQYLRVRGGDYPTHIHLDTGNNQYYDQYFGADDKFVKLEANGNVLINASNLANNSSATWTFDDTGDVTIPGNIQSVTTGFPFSSNISGINTGSPTVLVTLTDSPFGAPETGQVTITGVVGTVEANNTWYYLSIDPSNFQLYYDQALINPVDGTTWTAYVSGGLAVALGYSNLAITGGNVSIVTNTGNTWTFGTDGSLTLPIGISIDDNVDPLYPKIIADSGKLFSVQGQGANGSAALAWSLNPNTDTQYAAVGVNKGGGDDLAKVVLTAGNTTPELKVWKFDETGNITLPQGGIVYETTIPGGTLTGNTIALKPQGGTNADQQLLVYPTALGADANHLHLTTGNLYNTELFLGNDDLYVKLANTGNVVINSNNGNGSIGTWTFGADGYLTFPRDTSNVSTDPYLLIEGGGTPTIQSVDVSLAGPANLSIVSNYLEMSGFNGNTVTIYADNGEISASDYLVLTANTAGNTNSWLFDPTGSLTLPPINLGGGTDEQTVVQSQRKRIPSFRWSAIINGNTPTVVYTATNTLTTSMKVTVQVQHSGLGMELFDVSATYTGADTYYTVSNRVAPPTIAASGVVVDLNGSNTMQITITIDSGATTSWVTYDAVEFGIPND